MTRLRAHNARYRIEKMTTDETMIDLIDAIFDDLPENMSPYQASLEYAKMWGLPTENPEVTDRGRIGNCDSCGFLLYNDMGVACQLLSFPDGIPSEFYCGFYKEEL